MYVTIGCYFNTHFLTRHANGCAFFENASLHHHTGDDRVTGVKHELRQDLYKRYKIISVLEYIFSADGLYRPEFTF